MPWRHFSSSLVFSTFLLSTPLLSAQNKPAGWGEEWKSRASRIDGNQIIDTIFGFIEKRQYAQAMQWIDHAVEQNPGVPFLEANRGIVFHAQGDYARAIQVYDKVLKMDALTPQDRGFILPLRASSHYRAGHYRASLIDRRTALKAGETPSS